MDTATAPYYQIQGCELNFSDILEIAAIVPDDPRHFQYVRQATSQ